MERKLLRCQALREQGYDLTQALFLSGLPRKHSDNDEDDNHWVLVQDDVAHLVYYFNELSGEVCWDKPSMFVWRCVVVSPEQPRTYDGSAAAVEDGNFGSNGGAREWEFRQARWIGGSVVGFPPRPPPPSRNKGGGGGAASPIHRTI